MNIKVNFTETKQSFNTEFGEVFNVSDGGYERGLAEGYANGKAEGYTEGKTEGESIGFADAINKRTDLIATSNGDYTPTEDSTGFKSVKVNVQYKNKLAEIMNKTVTEITAGDLNGATQLKDYAFYNCGNLISVAMPNTITTIDNYACGYCRKLKSIVIPNSVTTINTSAFDTCADLASVTFGENSQLKTIGNAVFCYCYSLPEITIPNSVTKIGNSAFNTCRELQTVTIKATTPPTLGTKVFNGCDVLEKIIVPIGCGDAYKGATNWSAYADIIVEGDI